MFEDILQDPLLLAVVGGGGILVLGALALFLQRRLAKRRQGMNGKAQAGGAQVGAGASVKEGGPPTVISDMDVGQPGTGAIEVDEVDPLSEAAVYIEFGYIDRAAALLRWYVDETSCKDIHVLRKLLKLYVQLQNVDAGGDILERLCFAQDDHAYLKEAVIALLRVDEGNLSVRVLAETHLGLGPDRLDSLLGRGAATAAEDTAAKPASPVRKQGEAKAPPAKVPPAKAQQTARAPKKASPPAASGKAATPKHAGGGKSVAQGGVLPKPAVKKPPHTTSGPAALPPREVLVQGVAEVGTLGEEERDVLRAFVLPERQLSFFQSIGDVEGTAQALTATLKKEPGSLAHLGQLLKLQFQLKDIEGFARTLWELFSALGPTGGDLKSRFLSQSEKLGPHPVLASLAEAKTSEDIRMIGRQYGYLSAVSEELRQRLVHKSVAQEKDRSAQEMAGTVLEEVDAYLDYGDVDSALSLLEGSLLANAALLDLYPPLLDLYERMDDIKRLTIFSNKVKRGPVKMPRRAAVIMIETYERMRAKLKLAA